jgi:hypothetical protein
MRIVVPALAAATAALPLCAPAHADDIDFAIVVRVTETATKGYVAPEAATVSNIRKSRAMNGTGYCGEVSIEGSAETTTFHVILETPNGPSVLRLSDYPESDMSPSAQTVRQMMKNFGCVE